MKESYPYKHSLLPLILKISNNAYCPEFMVHVCVYSCIHVCVRVYMDAYMLFLFSPIILLVLVANRIGRTEKGS